MSIICKLKLKNLYKASEIAEVWHDNQHRKVIAHPKQGLISLYQYRAMYNAKPCPYCAQKMVHGKAIHTTLSRQEAVKRGYEYVDIQNKKVINQAGDCYFHPHYVSLDHQTNKARCPEKMFDYNNMQIMCWRCNHNKGDNNAFELQHTCNYLNALADEALDRYPLL